MLVRYKGSSELHAMKTLRKEALIRRNQVRACVGAMVRLVRPSISDHSTDPCPPTRPNLQLAHTSTERFILQNIAHPFLMRLSYAFQTKEKPYMVVDYMAGGELFFWLKKVSDVRYASPCRETCVPLVVGVNRVGPSGLHRSTTT